MATVSISIGVNVAPWVYAYLRMVSALALRTQQLPLMDVVERVCLRGITLTSSSRCARCGGDGHSAPHCPWPADERDLERCRPPSALPTVAELDHWMGLGPSSRPSDTGRNEREIAPVSGLRIS